VVHNEKVSLPSHYLTWSIRSITLLAEAAFNLPELVSKHIGGASGWLTMDHFLCLLETAVTKEIQNKGEDSNIMPSPWPANGQLHCHINAGLIFDK